LPVETGGVVTGWSIDSRTLVPGDLFFALRGPNHDGHDHIDEVLRKGAAAVVVDRDVEGAGRIFQVEDTLAALQKIAKRAREMWAGSVIGVTGSAGKTTTKDVIAEMLATQMRTAKTVGNLNNHAGVPLSLLRVNGDAQVAVIEMGMNHAGEIRELAAIARPDTGVVTNVGTAHIEAFESIEGIAEAKRELIEALPEGGTAVLNADDPRVAAMGRGRKAILYGLSADAHVRAEQVALRTSRPLCEGVTAFRISSPGSPWRRFTGSRRSGWSTRFEIFDRGRCAEDGSIIKGFWFTTIATTPIPMRSGRCSTCCGTRLRSGGSRFWGRCSNLAAGLSLCIGMWAGTLSNRESMW